MKINTKIKYKVVLSLLFLGLLTVSCAEDKIRGIVIDTDLVLFVKDQTGLDLLNPENPGSFKEKDINLYTVKDGEKKLVFESHLDAPRGFSLYKSDSVYAIQIFLDHANIIQWNETESDTIKSTFKSASNYCICDSVWINGKLVWGKDPVKREVELIKSK